MKKLLATVSLVVAFIAAHAQDTTLKEYVGKYTYPSGSFITSSDIMLDGNILRAVSDRGSATLEKRARDTFALLEHDGMAYFFRNAEGKVARIKVVIGDLLLEGTKDGVTALLQRNKYFYTKKEGAVK